MNTQDIRKEQEQVLAHAAERPSELFGLLDYIFDHANGDVDEAETRILDEIKRWVRDMCKMIAGKKVQLKKLKEQLLSAPTLTPVEAYYAMNSGCSGEGERVQSSHISDPTAKAAIGALDYIIRTWRDDYKKSLKKYGTLAGDIYLLEMAADYVGGEQGTVVRQIYVDGVFWKDAVGFDEIFKLYYALKAPYRKKAQFLCNEALVLQLMTIKDNNGNYIWKPGLEIGKPDTLLNRPLKTSAFMPEIKGGSKVMAFGDYSYYWVADRQNRTFRRLNELYARTDQVGFLTTQRVDGKLILPEAVQLLQMAPQG